MFFSYSIFILCILNVAFAFDSEQLEVFDVVEEVKENFYDLLNIPQNASSSDIRSAFRSLSLKLHPDKNLEKDTSEQFRNLVSVYEVLKSPNKRKYYDEVLVNGLPNWKSAIYYYRYVRKMGMTEVCIILFSIITIGQYLINWASYFEKVITIKSNMKRKPARKGVNTEDLLLDLPKPTVFNTLPFQIPRFLWYSIINLPSAFSTIKEVVTEKIENSKQVEEEEEVVVPKPKTVRKRNKGFKVPEGPTFEANYIGTQTESSNSASSPPPMTGGLWTDDDLEELIRLVKKYPQGAQKRWESIAEALGRSVPEVTFMANKMKEKLLKTSEQPEEAPPQIKVKQKTKKEVDVGEENKKWNQTQQKALEDALAKYPKGCTDRWDRIADYVPNKTKEECMARFRYLAETLKKQKENTEPASEETTQ